MKTYIVFFPIVLSWSCSSIPEQEGSGRGNGTASTPGDSKPRTAQSLGVRSVEVGKTTEVTADIAPLSYCLLVDDRAVTSSAPPDESAIVVSDANGAVSLDFVCNSNATSRIYLDCTSKDGTSRLYSIDIEPTTSPVAELRLDASRLKPIPGSFVRSALTGDLMKPTQAELRAGHYPPRPDPTKDRKRYEQWIDIVRRPFTIVPLDLIALPRQAGSVVWDGFVALSPVGHYFEAFAAWNLPAVSSAVSPLTSDTFVYFWVGLDGWGTQEIVQAGAALELHATSGGNYTVSRYPWTETYPNVLHAVPNLTIHTHDLLYVTVVTSCDSAGHVCVHDPDPNYRYAFFDVSNVTAGKGGSVIVAYNSKVTFTGTSAEWIVESISSQTLPKYEDTTMSYASVADSATPQSLTPFRSTPRVVHSTNASKADSTAVDDQTIRFHWKAP
jgi:hypothetical protein